MQELTVFDLDDTILKPDPQQDQCSGFLKPVHEIIPEMWTVFEQAAPKKILTTRHPELTRYIKTWVGDCDIICRDFCLTSDETDLVSHSPELTNIFLYQMIEWKCSVLNTLAQQYDKVVFYEDMKHRFNETALCDNVEIRLPVHLQGDEEMTTGEVK